uniref:receptor protein-tyrosine kinase n=1 Tax=Caenorhabditis tropicalis TaxID=1561998 RepID=A0A1I7TFH7_9PELO
MRKRALWTVILLLFRIVSALLPNETFDLSRYYEDRIVIDELEDGSETSYYVAAQTREEAVDKLSLLSSNCSLLDDVEEYTCNLDETFCNYPNNTVLKTYKFEEESCRCHLNECDSNSNSSQMILYPGCFCETREKQCDLKAHAVDCPQWTNTSDHKELVLNSFQLRASKYRFDYFVQAGSETAILNKKTVSMISKLFRQSGFNCTLQFMHHFNGQSPSSKLVVRATNQYGERRVLYEYTDKLLRAVWKHVSVPLGSFSEPFRISIDCETGSVPKKKKTKTKEPTKIFACGLANIHFDGCSDIRNPLELCSHGDQFFCSTTSNSVCLKDVQCDLRADCDDGSDEMECGFIPGTMCNFDSPDGFCDGWIQRTRIMGSHQSQYEPTTVAPLNRHEETPNFPRTNPKAYDPESSLFETCTVRNDDSFEQGKPDHFQLRFYVCTRTYSKTWDISIISKSGNPFDSGKTFLYEGAYDATLSQRTAACEWERVIILVPRQNSGFRLGIFVESFPREDFFAIDDLSFSPTCFERGANQSTWDIPDLKISTCEASGIEKPPSCKKDRELDGQTGHFLKEDGSQEWTVPLNGFYRIDACGAGGGSTSLTNGEPGDCVTLQVHLMENIALRMLVGQVGESPCLTEQEDELRPSSCSKSKINERRNREGGAGGGGATLIKVDSDHWNVVVGGGAGASSVGDDVYVGYGASAVPMDFDDKCNTTCSSISHSDFFVDRSENGCPSGKDNHTTVYGGFGGGGNSCGMLGGSGAGYRAGNPFGRGRERSGTSNVTDNFSKDVLYFQSNRVEEGYIKIKFCRKKCAKPSVCRFRKDYYDEEYCGCPDGSNYTQTPESCACPLTCPYASTCQYRNFTFEPFCLCDNGKFLDDHANDYCEEAQGWAWYNYLFLVFLIFTIIGAILVIYHYQSREKQMKQEIFDLTQMKSPDYLYDDIYFGRTTRKAALDRLDTIPRDEIKKGRVLGKGNFGEVFYGVFNGEKLAVKTISKTFSASQSSQADFCNEALCMGTFVGDNVVKLIGIDFNQLPFMIAIEYMEGGDLLTFVKDSRPNKHSLNPFKLTMSDLVKVCRDVASGCRCLESYGYVHRDIAARNILLTTRGENRVAKIADFGMAKEITYGSEYYRVHGRAMLPIKWTPPEAFIDGVFTTKSDVWSFGVLCWEVFSLGVVPYPNRRNEEVMLMLTEGARLEYPYGIPTRIYQMMRDCWGTIAEDRPMFTEVVNTLDDILIDPSCIGMEFPIHPTVRACFARSQSTPASCDTPLTTMTEISNTFTELPTAKISSPLQDMQDRINLHELMLKREKPYSSEMTECVVASLRKDLARVQYETGMASVPQPEYLSPQNTDETARLIPAGQTLIDHTPPASFLISIGLVYKIRVQHCIVQIL